MRWSLAILLLLSLVGLPLRAQPAKPPSKPTAITIRDMRYQPASVTIKAGETIIWTNNDDRDHTVTATDGSFKSGKLGHGESFRYTFTKKGRFAYACEYHPRMKGTVVVE